MYDAAGKNVTLVKDVSDTDRYGRLLRFVFVGDLLVNYELVREGYATATPYSPDVSCKQTFYEAQLLAIQEHRVYGLRELHRSQSSSLVPGTNESPGHQANPFTARGEIHPHMANCCENCRKKDSAMKQKDDRERR